MQGEGGQASIFDGQAVSFGSAVKVEMTASGMVRLDAANIHVYTPQEINIYRSRIWCDEKVKGITPSGTKSNPPTGRGDDGFTFNNEFNVYVHVSVLCGTDFVCYRPFKDDPEETETPKEWVNWLILADHVRAGLTVVAGVAIGAGYLASVFITGGATLAAAGSMVAFAAPAGIQLPKVLITTKTLTDVAFWGSATVTATNIVVKVNDSAAYVTGYNVIGSTFGQKPYEFVRDTSKIGSDIVFAFGLQNIMVYGTNRNRREEVQSEGCRETDFYVTPEGTAIPSESYHSLSNVDARKW